MRGRETFRDRLSNSSRRTTESGPGSRFSLPVLYNIGESQGRLSSGPPKGNLGVEAWNPTLPSSAHQWSQGRCPLFQSTLTLPPFSISLPSVQPSPHPFALLAVKTPG